MSVTTIKPFGTEFLEAVQPVEIHGSAQTNRTFIPTTTDLTFVRTPQGRITDFGGEDERAD